MHLARPRKLTNTVLERIVLGVEQANLPLDAAAMAAGISKWTLRRWVKDGKRARDVLSEGWQDSTQVKLPKLRKMAKELGFKFPPKATRQKITKGIEDHYGLLLELEELVEQASVRGEVRYAEQLNMLARGGRVMVNPETGKAEFQATRVITRILTPAGDLIREETREVGPSLEAIKFALSRRYARWVPRKAIEVIEREGVEEFGDRLREGLTAALSLTEAQGEDDD